MIVRLKMRGGFNKQNHKQSNWSDCIFIDYFIIKTHLF